LKKISWLVLFCGGVLTGIALLAISGSAGAESISKDKVNIRSGPSIKNRIIFKAPLGYPIKVEKKKGEWVFFRDWENDTGWVHKRLVSEVETAVIRVKIANVRSSPGKEHQVAAKASRGEIYRVLERSANWLKLGYYFGGEVVGWVRSDLVFSH